MCRPFLSRSISRAILYNTHCPTPLLQITDLLERMGEQFPDIDDYIFVNSVSTGNLVKMIFCPIEQGLYVRHRAFSERRQ